MSAVSGPVTGLAVAPQDGATVLAAVAAAGFAACAWLLLRPGDGRERLAHLLPRQPVAHPGPAESLRSILRRVRRSPALAAANRAAAVELCDGLAAELRAGRSPAEALVRATAVLAPSFAAQLAPAIASARDGDDVSVEIRRAGDRLGISGLSRLGVCWRVGAGTGGSFAPAVERLADALRDEEAARQQVAAQLAGARATARLLAGLPFLGALLALNLGINPVRFWFGGPLGYVCLASGLSLDLLGLLWMRRLSRRAEAVW